MASDQFRRQLKQEATRWQQEGWINPEQHARLVAHYNLEQLDGAAHGQFVTILIGIGCVLVGIGCITFVAANWQLIPRMVKVLVLVGVFLAVNIAGTVLHRQDGGRQRLGQGLLLLGALVFGGNLALMGQLFHQSGSGYGLCLVWGLGTLTMAYGLRLTSLGVLAQFLTGIGYVLWLREASWPWISAAAGLDGILQQMPLLTPILFLPLAYRSRSRSVFIFTALGVLVSLLTTLAQLPEGPTGVLMVLGLALPVSLLWTYDDRSWLQRRGGEAALEESFRPLARAIAIMYLGGVLYIFSFYGTWNTIDSVSENIPATASMLLPWTSIILLSAVAILGWIYLGWPRRTRRWGLSATDWVVLGFVGLTCGISLAHWYLVPIPTAATFMVNVLLAVLGIGIMREGLDDSDRSQFWCGLILLVLQILTRVLEYNTGLLVKSFTFLLCGVAVIALGYWFERHIHLSNHQPTP